MLIDGGPTETFPKHKYNCDTCIVTSEEVIRFRLRASELDCAGWGGGDDLRSAAAANTFQSHSLVGAAHVQAYNMSIAGYISTPSQQGKP
jgi:hypothetical protein